MTYVRTILWIKLFIWSDLWVKFIYKLVRHVRFENKTTYIFILTLFWFNRFRLRTYYEYASLISDWKNLNCAKNMFSRNWPKWKYCNFNVPCVEVTTKSQISLAFFTICYSDSTWSVCPNSFVSFKIFTVTNN